MLTLESVIFREAFVLLQNAKNLNNSLEKVVDLIVEETKANRHIFIGGAGKCSTISLKTIETMRSLGIPTIHLDAYLSSHGDLGSVLPNHLVIFFSKSGETPETVQSINGCGAKGAKIVSISCSENSTAGKAAISFNGLDIVLKCDTEACHMNIAPTSSTTLFAAIGDALACVAAERLGMNKEKFLINHMSGSLGDQLKKELGK